MSALFTLEILTPERCFLREQVEALTVDCPDGQLTVLGGHAPLIGALCVGTLRIKQNGAWREAFHSEGFLEVRPDEVLVFVQACEWPEEIDSVRAHAAAERAEKRIRSKQSLSDYHLTQLSLARAMMRLRISGGKK